MMISIKIKLNNNNRVRELIFCLRVISIEQILSLTRKIILELIIIK